MAGETGPIRELIRRAHSGLRITGSLQQAITPRVMALRHLTGMERLLSLLDILERLACAQADITAIVDPVTPFRVSQFDAARMEKAFNIIQGRHRDELNLATVAAGVGMTPTSFSRFFRQKTGKTFSLFLIETRLTDACQQLLTTDRSITEIAYTSGFSNLSNFNRQFKRFKKMCPRAFRAAWNV